MKNKKGFTLAEVLITLGIIGVVAAMTIPTLMANYQKQQYVTQLKQQYSLFSQALNLLKADEGVSKISDSNMLTCAEGEDMVADCYPRVGEFFKKYFKVVKDCGIDFDQKCFATDYRSIDEASGPSDENYRYRVITANGATIAVTPATNWLGKALAGTLIVDVNGPQKPNIYGRDFFGFAFYYDGSIDALNITPECKKGQANLYMPVCKGLGATAQEARDQLYNDLCFNGGSYGAGCAAKILNDNWKMDY